MVQTHAAGAQDYTNGEVVFANHFSGILVAHVFAPCPTNPTLSLIGNGAADFPPGTVDWNGFPKIGEVGISGRYSAAGTFAQLLSANGADQPEALLAPQSQTTTFRTGAAAGYLRSIYATLTNVPADAPVATIQMVAWDNGSGNYPTWTEALPAWQSGLIAAGKALPINVTNIGGPLNVLPYLLGLQSFNLFFGAPPTLANQPQPQTAEQGFTVTWSAHATGSSPLIYQWFLNGINVSSNTADNYLTLSNVQFSQSGPCTVVVTNLFGAVTSTPAMLSVILPVPKQTLPALRLTCDPGTCLHLSCAADAAAAWQDLGAVTLSSPQQSYADLADPLPPSRFYRAWHTNTLAAPPVLQMSFATKLTLTGAIGDKLRIDYINQLGPTDAWMTLDTVTLTNTVQPWFDYTMFRQPARLYRLGPVP